mgnify:CR=1 FL=1
MWVNGSNKRLAPHELDHTGGLRDVNLDNSISVQSIVDNLMTQAIAVSLGGGNPSVATKLEKVQIEAMSKAYTGGKLNKNTPVSSYKSILTD